MQAYYTSEPEALTYMKLPDGNADVWLRKNIEESTQETEDGTQSVWTCDEVSFRTTLSKTEIEDDFDTIFENGGTTTDEDTGEESVDTPTLAERVAALEEALIEIGGLI